MAKKKKTAKTSYLIMALICLAISVVLPMLTDQVPRFGQGLRPMHIPVLIAGFSCGPVIGFVVGLAAPMLSLLIHGVPAFMPMGFAMGLELATYGLIAGLLYSQLPRKTESIYVSLITAMIVGRIVWGASMIVLSGRAQTQFTYQMFMKYAFIDAMPAILFHIVLIPAVVIALEKANLTYRGRKLA
jgi:hypothetical protein